MYRGSKGRTIIRDTHSKITLQTAVSHCEQQRSHCEQHWSHEHCAVARAKCRIASSQCPTISMIAQWSVLPSRSDTCQRLFLVVLTSNPLWAITDPWVCFRNSRVRRHSGTPDQDVFVPFLQGNRKRQFFTLFWCQIKSDVPGLAGPQTRKPDFL